MTIEPFKMRVTPEQMKTVLTMFYGENKYNPDFLKYSHVYMSEGWPGFGNTESYYEKDTRKEITYSEFIQKYDK
jgi:hypothetical protein